MDIHNLLELEETVAFEVAAWEAGERLDRVLVSRLLWASRSAIQRFVQQGRARLDGIPERRSGRRLHVGSRVDLCVPKTPRDLNETLDDLLRLRIVGNGPGWIAVEKPGGIPSHPGGGVIKRTMLSACALALEGHYELGGPWLPHRLDRETSGVLIVALTRAAQQRLVAAFASGAVRRFYMARVRGAFAAPRALPPARSEVVAVDDIISMSTDAELRFPLRTVGTKPSRIGVHPKGVAAHTRVWALSKNENTSELLVEPITGRQHQIRVHLAEAGHAIVGDPLYDASANARERLHLHAFMIELPAAGGASGSLRVGSSTIPSTPWCVDSSDRGA